MTNFGVCDNERILALDGFEHSFYRAWFEKVIIAEEPAILSLRKLHGPRKILINPHFRLLAKVPESRKVSLIASNNFLGIFRRAAIEHHDLDLFCRLNNYTFESRADERSPVVSGDAD